MKRTHQEYAKCKRIEVSVESAPVEVRLTIEDVGSSPELKNF